MKYFLPMLFSLFVFSASSQNSMYRRFPQTQAFYGNCYMQNPVKISDGGYIFSYFPWSYSYHGMYPVDQYTIKTDSNFIPQWKKPYYSSVISLPTGGVILVYGSTIEKITASGIQVWIKELFNAQEILVNDGVCYSNKIRLVGRAAGDTGYPWYSPTSQAYTLLMDTSGAFISQSLFYTSYSGSADFSKIKRDPQGNFYVYSTYGSASNMSLAKFDSSFTFTWAKTWSSSTYPLYITDMDFLPNGRIFATGMLHGIWTTIGGLNGALLKFNSQGNLINQKFFIDRYQISGLCKKSNGNYIVSSARPYQDSLFMFEADTSMNISWYKLFGKGTASGTSIIKNNTLYTPIFLNSDPVITTADLNGNSCSSYSLAYSQYTSSLSLIDFTLTPTTSTAIIISGTTNILNSQPYIDSCNCPAFISVNQNNICAGSTGTINIIGTGNLSWYSTATGNSFVQSGSQYVYTSNTPTTLTIYAQDSACTAYPIRTQINLAVHAVPSVSLSSGPTLFCDWIPVTISAIGASTYTWSNNTSGSSIVVTPTSASTYTVVGSNGFCQNSKTISLSVLPHPTITISTSASDICLGETITLLANGANYYYWNTGSNLNILYQNPSSNTNYTVTGTNTYGCSDTKTISITVNPLPLISLSSSQSTICQGESAILNASGASSYTWNAVPGSFSLNISPNQNTTYIVIASSQFGCLNQDSITQYVNLCTNINSLKLEESSISIFPNPTNSHLEIVINSISENSYLEIVSALGQIILSQKISDLKSIVNLNGCDSGIYYLNLYAEDKALSYKIIKY